MVTYIVENNHMKMSHERYISGVTSGGNESSNASPLIPGTFHRQVLTVHKTLWESQISQQGFASCILITCNFKSYFLDEMIQHYKMCPAESTAVCMRCEKTLGNVPCACSNSAKLDSKGSQSVSSSIHLALDIVQESAPLPEDAYVAPKKINMLRRKAWEEQLKESQCIPCHNKNCYFIAMSIEDMINHFRYCRGDSTFAKFECVICHGRVTTLEILQIHMKRSHSNESGVSECLLAEPLSTSLNNAPTPINNMIRETASAPIPVAEMAQDETTTFWTPTKKKRGRPKKGEKNVADVSLSTSPVCCSLCSVEMPHNEFATHNAKVHTGLAVINGQPPVNLNDYESVLAAVKNAFRTVKSATCEKCGDVKKSYVGFTSHFQRCGRNSDEVLNQLVKCEFCDTTLLQCSMYAHIKYTHNKNKLDELSGGDQTLTENALTGKRKSAVTAVQKLKVVIKEEYSTTDALFEEDKTNSKLNERKKIYFVKKNEDSNEQFKIPGVIINRWSRFLKKEGHICCPQNYCNKKFEDMKLFSKHYFTCDNLPDEYWYCGVCLFVAEKEEILKQHVNCHKKELEIDYQSEGSDEESSPIREGAVVDRNSNRTKLNSKIERSLRLQFVTTERIKKPNILSFNTHAFEKNLNREITLEKIEKTLQINTRIEDWHLVNDKKLLESIPKHEYSVDISFDTGTQTEWKKFQKFESQITEEALTFFAGGPIRSLAWCPLGLQKSLNEKTRQYLALVTSNSCFEAVCHDKPDKLGSLIQLWDIGPLGLSSPSENAIMKYGILSESDVSSITWSARDYSQDASNDIFLPRLGYLASTSFDGLIRIYVMPCPEVLPESKASFPIFKVEPSLILKQDLISDDRCLSICWSENDIIAGGFKSGVVAFWQLSTLNFPKKCGNSLVVRPFLTFNACSTLVTNVAICPIDPRLVLVGSFNNHSTLWDITDLDDPIEFFPGSSFDKQSFVWSRTYPALLFSSEETLSLRRPYIKNHPYITKPIPISLNSSVMHMSLSDWGFVPLIATLSGNIGTCPLPVPLVDSYLMDRHCKLQLSILSRVTVVKDEDANSSEKSCETSKVIFHDIASLSSDSSVALTFSPDPQLPLLNLPLCAANKVVINPNYSSFLHFAVGYQCGIVRIMRLQHLQSSVEDKWNVGKAIIMAELQSLWTASLKSSSNAVGGFDTAYCV